LKNHAIDTGLFVTVILQIFFLITEEILSGIHTPATMQHSGLPMSFRLIVNQIDGCLFQIIILNTSHCIICHYWLN